MAVCIAFQAAVRKQNVHNLEWCAYRNLAYGASASQRLDLFLPPDKAAPLPLIVFIHGGGWAAGDKADATFFQLSKRGYALASINYRLMWEAPFPAQIEDCKAAISFLRKNSARYGVDPNRIGVWGCSAGGHLAMLLATTGNGEVPAWERYCNGVPSRIEAVCDWSGPADLVSLLHLQNLDRRMRIYTKNLVGPPSPDRELKWAAASPVRYVKHGDPPALIMHARGDQLVPFAQSEDLALCLKAQQVHCEFIDVDASQHCFYSLQNEATVGNFFDRFLKHNAGHLGVSRAQKLLSSRLRI